MKKQIIYRLDGDPKYYFSKPEGYSISSGSIEYYLTADEGYVLINNKTQEKRKDVIVKAWRLEDWDEQIK